MGTRPAVKPVKQTARKRIVSLGLDVPLLLVIFVLLVFGLLMLYSASWDFSLVTLGDSAQMFQRQLLWLALGCGAAVFCAYFDYHRWQRLAVAGMAFTVLALVVVLMLNNNEAYGASRSVRGGSLQPSELAKLMLVIYLSVWLYSKRDYLNKISFGLFPLALILGVVGALIFLQPDISAVLTVVALGGLMFFLAGGDLKQIVIVILLTALVGWGVITVNITGQRRVAEYLSGIQDPTEASYHVRRSIEAFANGGWVGEGIGKGVTKLTGLPFPPTDSIYAVIGEETGVLGATFTLILYGLILWRGLEVARRAPDTLGSLLAGGLAIWIALEAFVNMAVMVGLLPFAGNALPFISAGGSSLVVSLMAIGIIMNVSRLSEQDERTRAQGAARVIDFQKRRIFASTLPGQTQRSLKPAGNYAPKPIDEPMASMKNNPRRSERRRTRRKD
jgi:cell division protein FtsW